MRAQKEVRDERTDVIGFYETKTVYGINGAVEVEEQIQETTEAELVKEKEKLESDLAVVNVKLQLISEL